MIYYLEYHANEMAAKINTKFDSNYLEFAEFAR